MFVPCPLPVVDLPVRANSSSKQSTNLMVCQISETYVRSTKLSTGKAPTVERVLSTRCRTKENALPVFQLHEKNRPGQDQGDQVGKNHGERIDEKSIDEPQEDAGAKNEEH